MGVRTQWQNIHYISLRKDVSMHVNDGTSAAATHSVTDGTLNTEGQKHFDASKTDIYGILDAAGTKTFAVALRNKPNFNPGQTINNTRKAIGYPVQTGGTGYEIIRGGTSPTTTYEFDVDRRTIVPFLWCLFHEGAAEQGFDTGGSTANDSVEYRFRIINAIDSNFGSAKNATVNPDAEAFATLWKRMSDNDADSMLMSDGVVTSMTLRGAEGEPLVASVDFVGRFLSTNFKRTDLAAGDTTPDTKFSEIAPLMWHDVMITVEDAAAGNHIVTPATAFELTITPTVGIKRYDQRFPVRYVLGEYSVSGSITMPWRNLASVATDENYFMRRLLRDDSPSTDNITPFELNLLWLQDNDAIRALGATVTDAHMSNYQDFTVTGFLNAGGTDGNHTNGDFGIFMGISPTDVQITGEDESMVTVNFDCVNIRASNSTTQDALEIRIMDNVNYGIDTGQL